MRSADLMIRNGRILTLASQGEIRNGCIVVRDGMILDVFEGENILYDPACVIDAEGKLVIPGFVDCHTHLVHAGSRANELPLRQMGLSYHEIRERGGGIHATVRATRAASEDELYRVSAARTELCLRHGTTTAEIKTGYGLDGTTEEKMFRVIKRLNDETPLETVPTFLGAHVYPEDKDPAAYMDWLLHEGLDLAEKYAAFVDIYCDAGAYAFEETARLLQAARHRGLALKIHSGQFENLGATGLAAEMNAVSADHLDHVSEVEFDTLLRSGTIPVFLPGCSFYLNTAYPDARPWLDAGIPVALATDYNPGTCPSLSIPMMLSLAVLHMGFTTLEAIRAVTCHAARAIRRENRIGSLEPGKQADILICALNDPDDMVTMFGIDPIKTVIKKGRPVFTKTE